MRCDEARLRAVLPQLAQGLHALHEAGSIHRDIKPSNILVTREGRVVLLDFGLATRVDSVDRESRVGQVIGTVAYMAPEQARSDLRLSPAADWYAVGVILYEALTGRVPFKGPLIRVLMDKQQHVPPPPRALIPSAPKDLDQLCADLIEREPAERPTGAVVLRRLGLEVRDQRPATGTFSVAVTLSGRELELAQLELGLQTVLNFQAATMLVRGASGIGKSTLVQSFLDRARDLHPSLVVLQGRCYERETVPYQAMDSLIDHLSHHWVGLPSADARALLPREATLLPRLFPVLGRVPAIAETPRPRAIADPQELRTRAFGALREVLQRLAQRHPLVLVLDDLQWVDAGTLTVLADLMRPPDPPALLLVLSTRSEGSEPLGELIRGMGCASDTIELAPLSAGAATALAAELLGPDAAQLAAEVAREADGNPFFISELVKYVQSAEDARLGSISLDQVITERIAQLSAPARRVLELVALAGEPVTRRVLASAAEVTPASLKQDSAMLRSARFVRAVGDRAEDRVEPFHDRVRGAVTKELSPDQRSTHHRRLALALERWGEGSSARLAQHWHAAGDGQRGAEHARKAAEEALARFDFDRAADLYLMTLELGDPEPTEEHAIYLALGDALSRAGRPNRAAQAFKLASQGVNKVEELELNRRMAEELLHGGYLVEGLSVIRTVLAELGLRLAKTPLAALLFALLLRAWLRLRGLGWSPKSPGDLSPRALLRLDVLAAVSTGLAIVDPLRGIEYQARRLLCALHLGEPERLFFALAWESCVVTAMGRPRRAHRLLVEARRVQPQPEKYHQAWIHAASGMASYFSAAWRNARESFSSAARLLFDAGRIGWESDQVQLYECFSLLYLGELAELGRRVPGHVREAERRGDRHASVNQRIRLNLVWLARDDVSGAEGDLEGAMSSWLPEEDGFLVQHAWALHGRGEIALYAGADLWEYVQARLPALRRSQLLRIPLLRTEALHLVGRIGLASAVAARDPGLLRAVRPVQRRLDRERGPLARGFALLLRAGTARAGGDSARAVALLRSALSELEASETLLYATAARRRLGETLGGDEGRPLVAEADAWYAGRGVKNPQRMTAMLVPGWPHPDHPPHRSRASSGR